jgi:hypothetical protein
VNGKNLDDLSIVNNNYCRVNFIIVFLVLVFSLIICG